MLIHAETTSLTNQLCQIETLEAAWRKVRANKGGPGSDGVTIQQFETQLPKHLRELASELAEERYYPLPAQKFIMQKGNGSKREISVLALRDRIVQRAVCDLITPIYESKFLDCSFGYRPGQGVPHAVAEVNAIRAAGYEWVVHVDISNFFDSMDTHILMRFLRASVNEPLIIRLIQMWLDMGGILQPPKLPKWYSHLENTLHHVGGVDQAINQLLLQRRQNHLDYGEYRDTQLEDEWSIPINAMLSLGYTLLHNHVYAFINVVGFDPYCGYFHQPKHGHAALASDLMEEFRQIIVDGYVLTLVNNNRIKPEDFQKTEKGIRFTKKALDSFLSGFSGRMQQTFQHPTRNEKTNYLRCIELQVRHLARVIKGEEVVYKPFLIRA